jgi:glycosyltransferase involved in cell wall biosynthesis
LRILFLTYHFPSPEEPGTGRPWETAELLRALGHEPVVLTAGTHYMTGENIRRDPRGLWSEEQVNGFRVIKTYAPAGFRRSVSRRIINYLSYASASFTVGLQQGRMDLVLMATDPMFIMPVGFILSKLKGLPLMLDERDLYPDTAVALGYLRSQTTIRVLEAWHNRVRRSSRSVLAATPGIKRLLIEKGVEPSKIHFLPNIRSSSLTPDAYPLETVLRSRHNWRAKFVVLYTGNFGQANDLWTIIKAAQLLCDRFPNIHFVFIGAGEKKQEYVDSCTAAGLNNVQFLPVLPWRELRGYLATADLTVHAFPDQSFWRCSLATKIFDYLSAAKPIVFAGAGDTADLIGKASAGEVCKPGDVAAMAETIARLSQAPGLVREMGARGRRYLVTEFSRERLIQTMQQALSI